MSSIRIEDSRIVAESLYIINTSISNQGIKSEKSRSSLKEDSINNISKIDYGILNFTKIIGTHKNQAELIKELKNFYLISYGLDKKLILYDLNGKILEDKRFDKWIYNISEVDFSRNSPEKDILFQIICNTGEEVRYIVNNRNGYIFCKHKYPIKSYICFSFQDDGIVCNREGVKIEKNLFSSIQFKEFKQMQKAMEAKKMEQYYKARPPSPPDEDFYEERLEPDMSYHYEPKPFPDYTPSHDHSHYPEPHFPGHSHFPGHQHFSEHPKFPGHPHFSGPHFPEKPDFRGNPHRGDPHRQIIMEQKRRQKMMHYHQHHHDFLHEEYMERNRKIDDKVYKSGIQIDNVTYAFSSNKVDIKGDDKLIIYNRIKKKIVYEIKNYSFTLSPNNLCLISKEEKVDKEEKEKKYENEEKESSQKILLAACKKYIKSQKNGILLIKMDLKSDEFSSIFYDTGNFEVMCFCHILNVQKTGYIFKNDVIIYNTEYFLAGGFNKAKGNGVLKLYKIIYNDNFLETKIEYIQDIKPEMKEKFKGFNHPISCIIQSKKTGNLYISCWDGNIYSFTQPDMEYFSFYDKQNNEN